MKLGFVVSLAFAGLLGTTAGVWATGYTQPPTWTPPATGTGGPPTIGAIGPGPVTTTTQCLQSGWRCDKLGATCWACESTRYHTVCGNRSGWCAPQTNNTIQNDCGRLLTGVCDGNNCVAINGHPTLHCTKTTAIAQACP